MDALIRGLQQGEELTPAGVEFMAELLLDAGTPDESKERLLEELARKGETPAEISGFVRVFLNHAVDPEISSLGLSGPVMDLCGTGGDKLGLFNVSSTAMFVVAAAGGVVAKHGNRGVSSPVGGADVLEALGVRIDLPPEGFRRCLAHAGLGFMFAPHYHPAFKAVAEVRRKLAKRGVRTIFNIIGPLLNPARPPHQIAGVFSPQLCPMYAEILAQLGRERAWVISGTTRDGRFMDEVNLAGSTRICKVRDGRLTEDREALPEDFGMAEVPLEKLSGSKNVAASAALLEDILTGREQGPRRDMALLNSAAALACAGLAADMFEGIAMAREMVDTGAAAERLRLLREAAG